MEHNTAPSSHSSSDSMPLVLTVPETSKSLRIGVSNCYAIVRCGRLRNVKVGKRILIPRAAIFEFLGMTEETTA